MDLSKRVLPVTTLFFWKLCFILGTFYKELICCTNDPNVHILFASAEILFEGDFSLWVWGCYEIQKKYRTDNLYFLLKKKLHTVMKVVNYWFIKWTYWAVELTHWVNVINLWAEKSQGNVWSCRTDVDKNCNL